MWLNFYHWDRITIKRLPFGVFASWQRIWWKHKWTPVIYLSLSTDWEYDA